MNPQICPEPQCEGWTVYPEDHFCPWCGTAKSSLHLTLESLQGEIWRALPFPVVQLGTRVRLRLLHQGGSGWLDFLGHEVKMPSWLALESPLQGRLEPGQEMFAEILLVDQPAFIEEANITVECPPCRVSQPLFYAGLAELRISPDSPPVVLGQDPLEATLLFEVREGVAFLAEPAEANGEVDFPPFLDARRAAHYPVTVRLQGRPASVELTLPRLFPGGKSLHFSHPLRYEEPAVLQCRPFGPDRRAAWHHLRGFAPSRRFAMELSNLPGRRALSLRDVRLEETPSWLRMSDWEPTELAGGERRTVTLELVGDAVPDFHTLRLRAGAEEYFLDFSSQAAGLYGGWLLIDFGTSTTVAALLDENRRVELVPLEGDSHLVPSVVCYRDQETVVIGAEAAACADDPRRQRATVRAAKRQLGERGEVYALVPLEDPGQTLRRTPVQVVTDFLTVLLHRAQDRLLDQGRQDIVFQRLAVCHPARFSLRQMEALRQACETALAAQKGAPASGPSSPWEILTLPEPLTAALEFLSHKPMTAPQASVLVYDIGGGTVDFGLLSVTSQALASGTSVVRPVLLGADGHRWFGGEDITARVRDLVLARQPVRWNDAWAEQVKLHLLDRRPLPEGLEATLPSLAEVQAAIRPALVETAAQARKLCKLHGVQQPTVVLRVGLSSQFPVVEEVLQEAFPGSLQLTSSQLKECVVLGSALHPQVARAGGVSILQSHHLHVDQDCIRPATTSRLGLKMAAAQGSRFLEVVAAGTPVPAAGLLVPVAALALMGGKNYFTILENAGSDDRLVLESGQPNPDVQVIRHFEMELPAPVGSPIWQGAMLAFRVSAALEIALVVTLPDQSPRTTETVSALEYGMVY